MAKLNAGSDAVRARFQLVLEDSHAFQRLTQILSKTKNETVFLRALELVYDRAYGKPMQSMEVSGVDGTAFGFMSPGAIGQVLEALKKGSD